MFTGITDSIGIIDNITNKGDHRFRITCDYDVSTIDIGASIACSGTCLTVVDKGSEPAPWFDADVSAETLSKTNLGNWKKGTRINLERSLKLGDELGGHIVSGHVDGTAKITSVTDSGASILMAFEAPPALAPFIAAKGSVALDGVSLTVNHVSGNNFDINLIPHTQSVTSFGDRKVGDSVNLEIDVLARYVARMRDMEKANA